jgi:DNA-binding transcriptional LysR family regulator
MTPELRHLRYFVAVAEELHFGRAADRVGVAQPALSQQVRRLESMVGAELLARSTRSVSLTAAGAALLPHARRALAQAEEGLAAAGRAARGEAGHLTLGFIETAAVSLVPAAVRSFRAQRPGVSLTLRELPVDAQLTGLRAGTLDVGIVRAPVEAADLAVEEVAQDHLIAAVPSGHARAGAESLPIAELAEEPLVALSRDVVPGLHDQVIALFAEHGSSARITQEANSVQAVLGLVAAGLGIAVLPSSVRILSREGIAFSELTPSRTSPLLAVTQTGDRSPLVGFFVEEARATAAGSAL